VKRKEKEKKERRKNKNRKSKSLSQNVIKRDASGNNGELSCRIRSFGQIKANLAEIQPKKRQNVQKTRFFAKSSGVQ